LGAVALVLVIAVGALIVATSGGKAAASGSPAAGASGTITGMVSGAPLETPTEEPTATPIPTPSLSPSPAYAGVFSPTGSLVTARDGHTATLLQDGRVLLVGGVGDCTATACTSVKSAELYDPKTGIFSPTGSMTTGRAGHTSTLLQDGRVLVAGGDYYASSQLNSIGSVEIYDPSTGKFTATGSLKTPRFGHTDTLLPDGRVLIAGGWGPGFIGVATAELYDPTSGTFSLTGSMSTTRETHSATLLASGQVLIAGGAVGVTTELYNPATGTFTPTGPMQVRRLDGTATLLADGRVLFIGGENNCGSTTGCVSISSAEIYDPASGTFGPTGSMSVPRWGNVTTLLSDGRVLVAGGASGTTYYTSAEVYDPASGVFSLTSPLAHGGSGSTGTLLQDGRVLIAGGWTGTTEIGSAELYS
jgi:hypothetical protein